MTPANLTEQLLAQLQGAPRNKSRNSWAWRRSRRRVR